MSYARKRRALCPLCGRFPVSAQDSDSCITCRRNHQCPVCLDIDLSRRLGGFCDDCKAVRDRFAAIMDSFGYHSPPPEILEGRIRFYQARAAAGLPLFTQRQQLPN